MWLEGRETEGLFSEAQNEGHDVSVVRTPSQKCVRNQAYRILFHPLHVPGKKQDKLHGFHSKSLGFVFFLIYIY